MSPGSWAHCPLSAHDVEISTFPNSVGAIRKRWFTFEGPDRLSLRVDTPELTSGVVEGTLVWERVKKQDIVPEPFNPPRQARDRPN